jgi:phospholipase C
LSDPTASAWSTGGWVCSETFDHTSLIRFIEARFGVDEPNLTPWRRAVCGDLTSAFDFESSSNRVPPVPPVVDTYNTQAAYSSYHPVPPAVGSVPRQEPGVRPSRRLGYRFRIRFDASPQTLNLALENHGQLGVGLQARSLTVPGAPYTYTLGAGDGLTAQLPNPGTYDLSIHGPNGFFRHYAGSPATDLQAEEHGEPGTGWLTLRLTDTGDRGNPGRKRRRVTVEVADAYGPNRRIELDGASEITVDTSHSGGWYDLALTTPSDPSFAYQLAGRLESGARLTSDPQLGR